MGEGGREEREGTRGGGDRDRRRERGKSKSMLRRIKLCEQVSGSYCMLMRAVFEGVVVLETSFLTTIFFDSLSDEGGTPFEAVVLS